MTGPRPEHRTRELSGGLLLREMRTTDLDAMVEFVTRVFGTVMPNGEPDIKAGIWAAELLRGDHPTTRPEDGLLVLDQATGKIVASCFLISQFWQFDEVKLAVGRPELISTDPAYRGRGLVREQLRSIHEFSGALGQSVQALTGIPYYYRQYGYEPALIAEGGRKGSIETIPQRDLDASADMLIRPALGSDLPFITTLYDKAARRTMISAVRDQTIWRHELLTRDPGGDYWHELRIVEDSRGSPIGFFAHIAELRGESIICTLAELTDDELWTTFAPILLSYLRTTGEALAARTGDDCASITFDWTPGHPFLASCGNLLPEIDDPFAWYVRIADIGVVLRQIAPVLERRLAASDLAGFSGDCVITFYPNGLRMGFETGKLTVAEEVPVVPHRTADAAIPGRTFLQLLLGSRSLDELEHAFPFETYTRTESARRLLQALFPKKPSAVWPVA